MIQITFIQRIQLKVFSLEIVVRNNNIPFQIIKKKNRKMTMASSGISYKFESLKVMIYYMIII